MHSNVGFQYISSRIYVLVSSLPVSSSPVSLVLSVPHVPLCLSLDHLLALCVVAVLSVCINPMSRRGSRAQRGAVRCPSSVSPDTSGHNWMSVSSRAKGECGAVGTRDRGQMNRRCCTQTPQGQIVALSATCSVCCQDFACSKWRWTFVLADGVELVLSPFRVQIAGQSFHPPYKNLANLNSLFEPHPPDKWTSGWLVFLQIDYLCELLHTRNDNWSRAWLRASFKPAKVRWNYLQRQI